MEYSLQHVGVLGMKWGVRRNKAKTDSNEKSSDSKNKTKQKVKDIPDDELRKKVSRLNLEKQYSQLATDDATAKGKAYIQKFIKTGATISAVAATVTTLYANASKIAAMFEKSGVKNIVSPKSINIESDILKLLR